MRKYLLLFLSVSCLVTGCVNDDNGDNHGFPLSIGSVSLNGLVTRSSTLLATSGATISVSALSSGAVSATSQYTYTSGAWSAASDSPGLAPLAGTALCAYYPYSASITDKAAIPLTSASNVSTNDLSYGYATSVSSAGISHATFALQHAYTQLTFSFACTADYTGSKAIGEISISNSGIASSGSLNITQTSAVYTKVLSDVIFNAGITDISATPKASVLMVPTDVLSGDLSIVIKVGTEYKLLTLPVTYFADSKLEAGTNYQISVNLNSTSGNNNISLGSSAVQTTDWVTGTAANNTLLWDINPLQVQLESNCYIVVPSTTIYIPVSRASTANPTNFSPSDVFTTGLLWSDISADHVTVTSAGLYVKVTAGSTPGNSVVYAKNSSGNIVWSWHIWVTDYVPGSGILYNSRYWLDRNLGAIASGTGPTAYGLYYQWGRKDPFPGSDITTYGSDLPIFTTVGPVSTITAITNPAKFYQCNDYPSDWSSSPDDTYWSITKTVYDPCPTGWRVPDSSFFDGVSVFTNRTLAGFWYPDGTSNCVSSNGFWWSSNADCLTEYGHVGGSSRAYAYSVRCVHE